ncbi:MAG: surface-adhesin E family protein [Nitrospiraceae bacterium]
MAFTIRPTWRFPAHDAASSNADPFLKRPLAYGFGFGSLMAFLLLSSGSLYAEWVAIDEKHQSPGLQTVYVEPDTIRREGNLVTMVILVDWKSMQGNGRGAHRFMSTKTYKQFDCTEKRLRLLTFTEFSRHMGTGRPANGYVDTDHWLPVRPDTIDQALWDLACENG